MCMTSSGILINIWITFDKEKRGCVWHLQVFSLIFELPSIKRNEDVYDFFRYSHRYSNHLPQRETRMCVTSSGILIDIRITFDKEKWWCVMVSSGILINIRITFDKEKPGCLWHLQGFWSIFESPLIRRNNDALWYHQVFSSIVELPLTRRNYDASSHYQIFLPSRCTS